jgi:hypothetical protein
LLAVASQISRIDARDLVSDGEVTSLSICVGDDFISVSVGGGITAYVGIGGFIEFRTPERIQRFRGSKMALVDGVYKMPIKYDRSKPGFNFAGQLIVPSEFVSAQPIRPLHLMIDASADMLSEGIVAVKPLFRARTGGFIFSTTLARSGGKMVYRTKEANRLFPGHIPAEFIFQTKLPPDGDNRFGVLLFQRIL